MDAMLILTLSLAAAASAVLAVQAAKQLRAARRPVAVRIKRR